MPRNTERVEYITVAVRKDSHLMRQLETDVREKSQPKSHLLVSYAAEYVRLFLKDDRVPLTPFTPEVTPPVERKAKKEPEPFITSDLADDDLDIYVD